MTFEIHADKKSYTIALLFLVLIGLLVAWWYDHSNMHDSLLSQMQDNVGKDIIIKRWKDAAQREHVESQARMFTLTELKHSHDSDIIALRKEIGNIKNFISRTKIETNTGGQVVAALHDTLIIEKEKHFYAKTFNFKDKWLKFGGVVFGDSLHEKYEINNITTVDYKWEHEHWWKKKILTLNLTSENPNTTVNKVQTFVFKPDKPKWFETRLASMGAALFIGTVVGFKLHSQ